MQPSLWLNGEVIWQACASSLPNEIHATACSWSTLVEGGKERYLPPGKLTSELVLANQKQNKLLCL